MASLITLTGCAYTTLHGEGNKSAIDFRALKYPIDDKFNFVMAYGNYGYDMINTFEGYVVKDLVTKQAKTDLSLTANEIDTLTLIFNDSCLYNLPDQYYSRADVMFGGMDMRIYLYITYKNTSKKITFYPIDMYMSPDYYDYKLNVFYKTVKKMIERKKEYKNLPEPKGAYI